MSSSGSSPDRPESREAVPVPRRRSKPPSGGGRRDRVAEGQREAGPDTPVREILEHDVPLSGRPPEVSPTAQDLVAQVGRDARRALLSPEDADLERPGV